MTKGIIILVLLFPIVLYSQDTLQDRTKCSIVLKADIIIPVVSLFNIGNTFESSKPNFSFTIEKFLKKRSSLQLTMTYYWTKHRPVGDLSSDNVISYSSNVMELTPDFKFYLTKRKTQKGFYIGAYAKYIRRHEISEDHGPYPYSPNSYLEYIEHKTAFGGLIGYQFYIKNSLTIDFLLGLGRAQLIHLDVIKEENIQFSDDYSGYLDGQLAINIGYKINLYKNKKE